MWQWSSFMQIFSLLWRNDTSVTSWFSNAEALLEEMMWIALTPSRSVVFLLPLCHFQFPPRRQLCWKCVWTARKMNCNDCLMMTAGIPASGNYIVCWEIVCVCVIVACVERDETRFPANRPAVLFGAFVKKSSERKSWFFNEILRTAVRWSLTLPAFPLGQTMRRGIITSGPS